MRIRVDGKHFATTAGRFAFRGVTYGTFEPRAPDAARFPPRAQVERDFAAMREAGFTVVRTYTPPPADILGLAREHGLYVLPDAFYPDWRYLLGTSMREQRRVAREARKTVACVTRQLAGRDEILALSLGNEVPADVLRWFGTGRIASALEELANVVRDVDPERLVTYANYPTAEYLPLEALDFLSFNVFLERQVEFRRYLTRLHHLAGDRPLVLTEIGRNSGGTEEGEQLQAAELDWQLETALERAVAGTCIFAWTDEWWFDDHAVEGWHFGLTRADRSTRPALEVARRWNGRTVADLSLDWPSISIIICAYNAATTLDECLRHTRDLDYPQFEVIVVDDGSTDGTASIAQRHGDVRLIQIEHAGLSVARNEGFRAARGEIVTYLDSDAYPNPEWPYYLALGFDGPTIGGVGGPNLVPEDDAEGAHRVARAPGGPVHVLVGDDRAEHIPGCNMAFWKQVLEEVGGFDPIYESAGDDVDLCWRVLDRGWEIGFHPGAFVWHHRRAEIRQYLRQQIGYGRAEALVEARHPNRFTPTGTARWRGHIYNSFPRTFLRPRIYRGTFGAAEYQSVYRADGHALDIAHQLGVPAAVLLLPGAALAVRWPWFVLVALAGALTLAGLFVVDVVRVRAPRSARGAFRFRCGVALLHILQPLARSWGRARWRQVARQTLEPNGRLPGRVERIGRSTLLFPADRPRADLAACVVRELRRGGLRVIPANEWAGYDARVVGSVLIEGELVTSSHPVGCAQLRVRRRLRRIPLCLAAVGVLLAAWVEPLAASVILLLAAIDVLHGFWRIGPATTRVIERAARRAARQARITASQPAAEATAADA
jgi:glycosyltransferase involved in cell wall biosynthesis